MKAKVARKQHALDQMAEGLSLFQDLALREESYKKQLQREKELLVKVVENGVMFAVDLDGAISDKKQELAVSQDDFSLE